MFRRIISLFKSIFWSLEKQARYAGVDLGRHNFIASRFWSTEPYLIKIGDYCQITAGVKIFTHGGAGAARRQYPKFDTFGKVLIGDYVYIGNNSLIMPGVSIGNNVLIAAGSVVTKSVPSDVVIGGNPARIICSLETYINRNIMYNTETKGLKSSEKKKVLLNLEEDKFMKKEILTNNIK